VEFVPANLSEVPALIARRANTRPLVLAAVAEHDGRLYWGTNGEYTASLIRDGARALVQSGACRVSPQQPTLASFALGSTKVYEFMDGNASLRMWPIDDLNDPSSIAREPKMVAVCATSEVDLYGQCVSGTMNGRWYSGSGGQLDFMRGVHAAPDGQGFMLLHSTLNDGSSRIKLSLSPRSAVTTGIDLVDKVVSERGVAELAGRSLSERAHDRNRRGIRSSGPLNARDRVGDVATLGSAAVSVARRFAGRSVSVRGSRPAERLGRGATSERAPARRAMDWCSGGGSRGRFDDAGHVVAGDLPGGGVDAVERVDRRDRDHQGR
jgi:hypothetical protein